MSGPGLPPPQPARGRFMSADALIARVDRRRRGCARSARCPRRTPIVNVGSRALRQRAAARADRGPVPARKPRARAGDGVGAEGDRGAAGHRPRLQDLVRQGEPHQREQRARHRARRGAADLRRDPRDARRAGAHRRARARAMRARRAGRRRAADPGVPVPPDRSAGRRRAKPARRSTSRRASSSRPGTWRTWSPRSPAPATRNVLVTERGASFGYNTLVSDMRALPILARRPARR